MKGSELKELRKERGLTQEELAKKLSLTKRTIINYEKSEKVPEDKAKLFHFLLSESEGEKDGSGIKSNQPLEHFQTKAGSQYEELPSGKYKLTVPFVPVRAQARYVSDFCDAEFIADLEDMTFIVDRVGNGRYLAFEIQNDSMDDDTKNSIPDGAVVLARELGKQHWKSKFRTTQFPYWIIVHKTTILCKEIVNHDVENGIITCHSLNESPEYQDFDLKLDDVHQLFNIVKKTF